jgi:hypothetical protein
MPESEPEPITTTRDGAFWVQTKILDHIVGGSDYDAVAADDAWVLEDGLDPLLAVCREVLDSQDVANELAYVLTHLADDVIQDRRVYVIRRPEINRVELVARSATTDDVLIVSPDPLLGVRVVLRGPGAGHSPVQTYVDGRRVPRPAG